MRPGMTMVEVLITLVVSSLVIAMIGVIMNMVKNLQILGREFDSSFAQVNYTERTLDTLQDLIFRFGKSVDEIDVSTDTINGRIYVLSNHIDVTLRADYEDGTTVLKYTIGSDEKTIAEVPNASFSFSMVTSPSLGKFVEVDFTRWNDRGDTMSRKIVVPLVNMR